MVWEVADEEQQQPPYIQPGRMLGQPPPQHLPHLTSMGGHLTHHMGDEIWRGDVWKEPEALGTGVQLSGKKLHRNTRLAECDKYRRRVGNVDVLGKSSKIGWDR
ncbi:uncharacterized protein T551_00222 [Pneumocystis jirovecii RU7]|uniref:Uncharacterized protein n=1 Tax=Pneumocystis jirovecii (strain RU7) TaxID=1408657 RepID=A0A0W4ZWI5_PNEJ7|nr:uncharacterized protein T551_00222 [Pneumocystis jirovecii RU7]KTW32737.1 hypothetical protein T551_00222 [Pneumocystis jirovecii RU7]